MEIKYSARFRKQYLSADKQIKSAFAHTLEIFLDDPEHPSLRNHALKNKFTGYRSIDVTQDWRALFKEKITKTHKLVVFHMIGTHKDL